METTSYHWEAGNPLRWFRQVLESRFEVSTVVVGDGREEEVQETNP